MSKGLSLHDFRGSLLCFAVASVAKQKKARVTDDKVRAPRFFQHNPRNSSQIFCLCQQDKKSPQPRVLNVAEIFVSIDKERAKTGNTNLYGTTYNEWLKENER